MTTAPIPHSSSGITHLADDLQDTDNMLKEPDMKDRQDQFDVSKMTDTICHLVSARLARLCLAARALV